VVVLALLPPVAALSLQGASTLSFDVDAAKNRPVSKVINLLKDMQKTLEEEAKADQEVYDQLACWCETNDKEKSKAISDAEAKIKQLNIDIEELTATSTRLQAEIEALRAELGEEKRRRNSLLLWSAMNSSPKAKTKTRSSVFATADWEQQQEESVRRMDSRRHTMLQFGTLLTKQRRSKYQTATDLDEIQGPFLINIGVDATGTSDAQFDTHQRNERPSLPLKSHLTSDTSPGRN